MSTAISGSDLLPPPEAAEYIGVREQTLAVWRSSGRYSLPFVRCGRLIRYRRADLDAWLAARTITHTGEAVDDDPPAPPAPKKSTPKRRSSRRRSK
jgi:excisionase family DNA binding protein